MDYWIIPSRAIGGSEVRLINNWFYSKQHFPHTSKIVISPILYEIIKKREQFSNDVELWKHDIIKYEFPEQFSEIQNSFKHLLNQVIENARNIYFLLHLPIKAKKKKGQQFIYIHPGTTIFSNSNLKGMIGQFLFVFKADVVDVLDPVVHSIFRNIFFYKKSRIRLTKFGISEATFNLSHKIKYEKKNSSLAFIGTYVHLKQIMELLDSIENINQHIKMKLQKIPSFIIIGKGPLETEVNKKIDALKSKEIDIKQVFSNNPVEYLLKSKIIFSLQKHNNYPSQVLIEGILCGCLPVVTDCGNTKEIAQKSFSFYVSESFTPEDLAKACSDVLSIEDHVFAERSQYAVRYLQTNFSTRRMAEYYLGLSKRSVKESYLNS